MPVKLCLKFVAIICSYDFDPERYFSNDKVYKVNGTPLVMKFVSLEDTNSRGVIDRCVLESFYRFSIFVNEFKEFHINQDMMTWNLFLIKLIGVSFSQALHILWQSVYAVPAQHSLNSA